jgi:Uri superfamily endonuclease
MSKPQSTRRISIHQEVYETLRRHADYLHLDVGKLASIVLQEAMATQEHHLSPLVAGPAQESRHE